MKKEDNQEEVSFETPTRDHEETQEESNTSFLAQDDVLGSLFENGDGKMGEGEGGGGQETLVTPPPSFGGSKAEKEDGGWGFFLFLCLLLALLSGWYRKKCCHLSLSSSSVDTLEKEREEVRAAIEQLYEDFPLCCRHCHGSATSPSYWEKGEGEEECPSCYGRNRDPYDTTLKLTKVGEYKISPIWGVDPLYRGYDLPGQVILALREESENG